MTKETIREQCVYFCGPYKGYSGKAELEADDDLFHGEVMGLRDVVTFQGRTPAQLRKAFAESVDDYLAMCEESGEAPEKPFSGKFVMRVNPDVHRKLTVLADMAGKSLNQFISDALTPIAQQSPIAPPPAISVKKKRA